MGYSPRDRKESDTTERLTLSLKKKFCQSLKNDDILYMLFYHSALHLTIAILKESFGARKENSLKGPLLNHLTSGKTKHNFSSTLMLQASCIYGTCHPLSGNLPPPPPAQKTYHPLPNCKCHLNKRILKISRLIDVSLVASKNLPIRMKPP